MTCVSSKPLAYSLWALQLALTSYIETTLSMYLRKQAKELCHTG
jgi:hypothetical protein